MAVLSNNSCISLGDNVLSELTNMEKSLNNDIDLIFQDNINRIV